MNSRDQEYGRDSDREFSMVRIPFSYTMIPDPGMSSPEAACSSVSITPTTHRAGAPANRRSRARVWLWMLDSVEWLWQTMLFKGPMAPSAMSLRAVV